MQKLLLALSFASLNSAWSDHAGFAALLSQDDKVVYLKPGSTGAEVAAAILKYGGRCGKLNQEEFNTELKIATAGKIDLAKLARIDVDGIWANGASTSGNYDYLLEVVPHLDMLDLSSTEDFSKLKNPRQVLKTLQNQSWDLMEELFPKSYEMGKAVDPKHKFDHSHKLQVTNSAAGSLTITVTRPATQADLDRIGNALPGTPKKVGDEIFDHYNINAQANGTTELSTTGGPTHEVVRQGHHYGMGPEFIQRKLDELRAISEQRLKLETHLTVASAHTQVSGGIGNAFSSLDAAKQAAVIDLINERLIDTAHACVLRKKADASSPNPAAIEAPAKSP